MRKIYTISEKGRAESPKDVTLLEKYIPAEALLREFLRLLLPGPMSRQDVYSNLSKKYSDNRIQKMLNYVEIQEFATTNQPRKN